MPATFFWRSDLQALVFIFKTNRICIRHVRRTKLRRWKSGAFHPISPNFNEARLAQNATRLIQAATPSSHGHERRDIPRRKSAITRKPAPGGPFQPSPKKKPRGPKTAGLFGVDDRLVADVALFVLCTPQLFPLTLLCPSLIITARPARCLLHRGLGTTAEGRGIHIHGGRSRRDRNRTEVERTARQDDSLPERGAKLGRIAACGTRCGVGQAQ